MKNIGELMAKAQKVQSQMTILQSKMEQQEFTGEAANGAVKIVMTGKGVPVSVKLDKSVVDPNDVETLEDLLMVALTNARDNIDNYMASEMEKMQAGLGLPPGFKLPF
ncbi:MAG: YbaB/EbfC family nucleoid-associated protein [Alphaproteobacteria bacterium]|nr:YbaB/EbfC family nucleoid-associated protein [Alphaproteobacteria bacterium]